MEAVCTSERSGSIYQSTRCHKREGRSEWAYLCLSRFQEWRKSCLTLEATSWIIKCPVSLEPTYIFARLKIQCWWRFMFSGMWCRAQWHIVPHYAEIWSRKLIWHVGIYLPIYTALISQKTVFLQHVFSDVVWRYLKLLCIHFFFSFFTGKSPYGNNRDKYTPKIAEQQ